MSPRVKYENNIEPLGPIDIRITDMMDDARRDIYEAFGLSPIRYWCSSTSELLVLAYDMAETVTYYPGFSAREGEIGPNRFTRWMDISDQGEELMSFYAKCRSFGFGDSSIHQSIVDLLDGYDRGYVSHETPTD